MGDVAGEVAGVWAICGGSHKVQARKLEMEIRISGAVATSNIMIGVTAAASAFVCCGRGYVHPALVAPVVLGVVAGALASSSFSAKTSHARIKRLLAIVLLVVAIQMSLRAPGGHLGR